MTRITIFLLYFTLVFALGWYAMRRTRDASDYWIAGGRLGWVLGGATMAATHTSAGTFIGAIGAIYAFGWSFGWVLLAIPLAYWFTAAVLAPRFTRVREVTLPAFIERRYASPAARAVAAVAILVAIVVYIQAQIVAGGLVANVVFGLSPRDGMVLLTVVLLLYTLVGGMLAVVYTDFLQSVVMVLATVVAVPLAIRHIGGPADLLASVAAIRPDAFSWSVLPGALLFTMGLSFFLGSVATPEKVVRLYAMKNMPTIRRGILFTIVLVVGINLLVMTLGLVAIALFPLLPTGDLAMPMIARAVLPPVTGTVLLAAIVSAMMSTVDSLLIVAGSALSEDIYGVLARAGWTKSGGREARADDGHLVPGVARGERDADIAANRRDAGGPDPERRRLLVARIGILLVGTVPLLLVLAGVGEGELVQIIVLLF
ncbi:MAG: sodium:solute symporter family protein, partial [Gemmatimonadota bacterium]